MEQHSDLFKVEQETVKSMLMVYERTEKTFQEDVKRVQEWMKTQPHLPEILDDDRIANFLILNKCSVEKAKQKIDMYYTIRSLIPDLYQDINPQQPHMQELMDILYWVPLPQLTPEMYRVFVFKLRDKDRCDRLEPRWNAGHFFNVDEVRLKEDRMFGEILIFDMRDLSTSLLLKITPTFVLKFINIYQKVYSIPMKGAYIISDSSFIQKIMAIAKTTTIKPKLFERIHVCQDTSILHERIPKNILPKDYGGEGQSCEEIQEMIKAKLNEYKARFDELDKLRVDENSRPEPLENDDILGFHGNFKQLQVD